MTCARCTVVGVPQRHEFVPRSDRRSADRRPSAPALARETSARLASCARTNRWWLLDAESIRCPMICFGRPLPRRARPRGVRFRQRSKLRNGGFDGVQQIRRDRREWCAIRHAGKRRIRNTPLTLTKSSAARALRAPAAALRARAAPPRSPSSSASGGTSNGSPMAIATVANGFGICVRSQLFERPVAIGLEVKRQHRIAGRLREPHGARLRDAGRTARAVERERRRLARRHVALQLQQRLARRRATSIRAPCRSRSAR